MVGLVIEEMHQDWSKRLLDIGWVRDGAIPDAPREIGVRQTVDIGDDPLVLRLTRGS